MKKIILGFLIGLSFAVAGTALADKYSGWNAVITPLQQLTPEQQIALGHTYDQYTGQKLVPATLEDRVKALEARVSALEAK